MQPNEFLLELDRAVGSRLERLQRTPTPIPGAAPREATAPREVPMTELLTVALKKELEAAEEAAIWIGSETDVEVKLALMRQCGDEAKHYRLIEARLQELGVDTKTIEPLAGGYSPLFLYLKSLETTVERVAAGQYAREALAKVLNEIFIAHADARGDRETAKLYRDIIQPDEAHHHELGRKLLARLAVTDEQRGKARAAALRTLEIAEEVQEIARLKKGITKAPGC